MHMYIYMYVFVHMCIYGGVEGVAIRKKGTNTLAGSVVIG